MVRIAICDDDAVCLQNTCSLVEKWSAASQVPVQLIRLENGDDLLQKAAVHSFDIIFLDIMMPLLDGMETARELRQSNNTSKIIFLTSSSEFAVQSYSVRADNYLLKPVNYEQLRAALDHCLSTQKEEAKHLVVDLQMK